MTPIEVELLSRAMPLPVFEIACLFVVVLTLVAITRRRTFVSLSAWAVLMAVCAGAGCSDPSPEPGAAGGSASGGGGTQVLRDPLEAQWEGNGCYSASPSIYSLTMDVEANGAGSALVQIACYGSDAYTMQSPVVQWTRQDDGMYDIDLFCSECACPAPIHMHCELIPRELRCELSTSCWMIFR